MADLLECLIQIRALAETPRRAGELVRRFPAPTWVWRPAPAVWSAVEVLAHLADAELFFGTRLRLMLTVERPLLQPFDQAVLAERAAYRSWPPERALVRLTTRRADTCELLDRCGAAELERTGVHPRGGAMTVADVVAVMLAHDTDHLGQIRERLEVAVRDDKDGVRGPGSVLFTPHPADRPTRCPPDGQAASAQGRSPARDSDSERGGADA